MFASRLTMEARDEFDCLDQFIEHGKFAVHKNKLDKQNTDEWLTSDKGFYEIKSFVPLMHTFINWTLLGSLVYK